MSETLPLLTPTIYTAHMNLCHRQFCWKTTSEISLFSAKNGSEMHWRTNFFFITNFRWFTFIASSCLWNLSKFFLPIGTISPNLCPIHLILVPVQHIPQTHAQGFLLIYLSSVGLLAQICHQIATETSSGFQSRFSHSLHFLWHQCHILYLFLRKWCWKVTGYHMLWQYQVISSIIKFQIQIHHIPIIIQQ